MLINCDCSIDTDSNGPSVCHQRLVRARKSHKCNECRRQIQPGEQYEYVRGLWEKRWYTQKTCLGCYRIRQHLCPHGWIYGEVSTQVEKCIGFNYVTGA